MSYTGVVFRNQTKLTVGHKELGVKKYPPTQTHTRNTRSEALSRLKTWYNLTIATFGRKYEDGNERL